MSKNQENDLVEITSYQETEKDGKRHIVGITHLNAVDIRFTLTGDDHFLRGEGYPVDPENGACMKMEGMEKKQRSQKWAETHPGQDRSEMPDRYCDCRKQIVITGKDEPLTKETICNHLKEQAGEIYSKFLITITNRLHNCLPESLDMPTAVKIYGDSFLAGRNLKKNTIRKKKSMLTKLARHFGNTPIKQLTAHDIRNYMRTQTGKKASEALKLAADFIDYCRDKGYRFVDRNIFSDYLKDNPARKQIDPAQERRNALQPKALSENDFVALLKYLWEHWRETTRMLGVLLIAACGLTAADACKIKWSDLIFDVDFGTVLPSMLLHQTIKRNSGATHIFTRPVLPLAAFLLKEAYDSACEEIGREKIKGVNIVEGTAAELNRFCSKLLRDLNLPSDQLFHPDVTPFQAGAELLRNHYRYYLGSTCGLQADPAAVHFMMRESLSNDVTADYYRHFTSYDGGRYLTSAVERGAWLPDKVWAGIPAETQREKTSEGQETTVIHAPDSNTTAVVQALVTLKPDERFDIDSLKGLRWQIIKRKIHS